MSVQEWCHPELKDGEVLIGNFDDDNYRMCDWKTRRVGQKAYDAAGELVAGDKLFPVFVQRTEVEGRRIMPEGQFNMSLPRR